MTIRIRGRGRGYIAAASHAAIVVVGMTVTVTVFDDFGDLRMVTFDYVGDPRDLFVVVGFLDTGLADVFSPGEKIPDQPVGWEL